MVTRFIEDKESYGGGQTKGGKWVEANLGGGIIGGPTSNFKTKKHK